MKLYMRSQGDIQVPDQERRQKERTQVSFKRSEYQVKEAKKLRRKGHKTELEEDAW